MKKKIQIFFFLSLFWKLIIIEVHFTEFITKTCRVLDLLPTIHLDSYTALCGRIREGGAGLREEDEEK